MKQARRMLSILLTLVLLLGTLAVGFSAFAAKSVTVIKFGSYPQSEVTDSIQIGKLAKVPKYWKSFRYYSGTGSSTDGKMTASDYATYADFIFEGEAYRAIESTEYRPKNAGGKNPTSGNGSGYARNAIYYFKYEPIEWIVLGSLTEKVGETDVTYGKLLLSKKVLDSQPYQNLVRKVTSNGVDHYYSSNTTEANNYASSSLRTFLTGSFYDVAFSPDQQNKIVKHNYNCAPKGSTSTNTTVNDKVTALSYNDCINSEFGFSTSLYNDLARVGSEVTTYAVSQGITLTDGKAGWWLRTPDSVSGSTGCVEPSGSVAFTWLLNATDRGVRPVICLSTVQEDASTSLLGCKHDKGKEKFDEVPATCKEAGHEEYYLCKTCSAILGTEEAGKIKEYPASGHVDVKKMDGSWGSDGWCDNCGAEVMIHTDNSGSLQLSGPAQNVLDLIRKLVFKIEEWLGKLSLSKDGKSSGGTTTPEDEAEPKPELEGTAKALTDFADTLGSIIDTFKGISDKKSAEKEADRTSFFESLLGNLGDTGTNN